ncbi:hypothetical protein FHS31_002999 [Sphingomonas vulcanisoli]|uniref:Uncharacterized protein n=1 Tax=Sphingomonas vulcanisoli TaxID=1658060 RepID=A0ABX0TV09_9SPHN|nr:hypothetical protein [Sphingomonas vulcanisoli]NIJ09367.1 hypothetical protein [Sphingomonas vulcanisoli]
MIGTIFLWAAVAGGALFILVLAFATYEQAYQERRAKRLSLDTIDNLDRAIDRYLPSAQMTEADRVAAAAAPMIDIAA